MATMHETRENSTHRLPEPKYATIGCSPMRCKTNEVGNEGACLACGASQGEICRYVPEKQNPPE